MWMNSSRGQGILCGPRIENSRLLHLGNHVFGAGAGAHEAVPDSIAEEGLVHPLLQLVSLQLDAQCLPEVDVLLVLHASQIV